MLRPPGEKSLLEEVLLVKSIHLAVQFSGVLSLNTIVIEQFPYFLENDVFAVLLAEGIQHLLSPVLFLLQRNSCILEFPSELHQLVADILTGRGICGDLHIWIGYLRVIELAFGCTFVIEVVLDAFHGI